MYFFGTLSSNSRLKNSTTKKRKHVSYVYTAIILLSSNFGHRTRAPFRLMAYFLTILLHYSNLDDEYFENSLGKRHWLLYQCDHTGGSWSSVCPGSAVSSAKLQRVWPPRCCQCYPELQTLGRTIPGKPAAEPHVAEGVQRSRKDALWLLSYPFYSCWC